MTFGPYLPSPEPFHDGADLIPSWATAPVAALVLAAGAGRRYGQPKALVERDGQLLVERAVRTAEGGGCDRVVVVLGAAAAEVRQRADLGQAIRVENRDWASGIGSSLRVGLVTLAVTEVVATVVLLVDMPGVTPAAVRRLARFATPDALAMARYDERPGHPVLLGRDHWPQVSRSALGDVGARPYLSRHWAAVRLVPCGDVADDTDLDTPPPVP